MRLSDLLGSRLTVEEVSVGLPGLPANLDGFTIGVLADLHLGPLVPPGFVRRAAEQLAARKPGLVVVAGDLVSEPEALPLLGQALEPLAGAYAVLGNWDRKVLNALDRAGSADWKQPGSLQILINQGLEVAPGLWLAGIDDGLLGDPDIARALAGAPEGAVRLLLAHEPDLADRVEPGHRVALQISGHSHGGQVRLPFLGPVVLPPLGRKYHTGLNRAPHCQVYTNRGLGMVHLPVRVLCPPEITLLTLRREPEGSH